MSKIRVTKDVNKTLQDMANEINRLSKVVQEGMQGNADNKAKIRTVKNSDGTYSIEFKHSDGWLTTSANTIKKKDSKRNG